MAPTLTAGKAPGAVPLLGHALLLRNDPLAFLASIPAAGDLVEIRLGTEPAYVLCHPELVQQVLLDERTFDKQGPLWDKLRKFTGDGIGTCPYDRHRRQRRLVQPGFHRTRLPGYSAIMAEETESVVGRWRDGETVDVLNQMYAITTRVMAKTLMPAAGVDAAAEVCRAMDVVMGGTYDRATSPLKLLEKLPTPGNRRFEAAAARVNTAVDETVRTYRNGGGGPDDLVSVMMANRDDRDVGLTDLEVRDQIIILVTAGMETTASAVAWAFSLLAAHPEIEELVRAEADAVLGGRQPGWADLPKLEHAERVIKETLRLYPPGWMFTRSTTRDTRLAGREIPAGTTIIYSPYVIHRRADLFADPERFDPDRWRDDRAAEIPRHAYIPFGVGARKCIGDSFAMAEAPLMVSSIAARWSLRATSGAPLRPRPKFALGPHGLRLRLHRRDTSY